MQQKIMDAANPAAVQQLPLQVNAVCRTWGNLQALKDVSLTVRSGEIYGLVGPDGAGKTTLIRILVSLLRPDSGTVLVEGHDCQKDSQFVRSHIGYMPQRFSLYPDLTVQQNLRFFGDLYAVPSEKQQEREDRLYEFSHLGDFKQRRAGQLSGGMKQKLALSCVLMHAPRVILLDEPTVGVDPVSRSELWDILLELKEQGSALLVSTPYMEEAEQCDRVGLINQGEMLAEDTPSALIDKLDLNILQLQTDTPWETWQQLQQAGLDQQVQLFGDSIHITLAADQQQEAMEKLLLTSGVSAGELRPVQPGMEDLFLSLLQQAQAVSGGEFDED